LLVTTCSGSVQWIGQQREIGGTQLEGALLRLRIVLAQQCTERINELRRGQQEQIVETGRQGHAGVDRLIDAGGDIGRIDRGTGWSQRGPQSTQPRDRHYRRKGFSAVEPHFVLKNGRSAPDMVNVSVNPGPPDTDKVTVMLRVTSAVIWLVAVALLFRRAIKSRRKPEAAIETPGVITGD